METLFCLILLFSRLRIYLYEGYKEIIFEYYETWTKIQITFFFIKRKKKQGMKEITIFIQLQFYSNQRTHFLNNIQRSISHSYFSSKCFINCISFKRFLAAFGRISGGNFKHSAVWTLYLSLLLLLIF